jgi:pimeloyl-ACP methyl ester carboxylesterase
MWRDVGRQRAQPRLHRRCWRLSEPDRSLEEPEVFMNLMYKLIAALSLCSGIGAAAAKSDFECRTHRGEPAKHRSTASGDSVRALLSMAAYLDCPPTITLDGDVFRPIRRFPEHGERAFGLSYTVFDKTEKDTQSVDLRVIAYRGTQLKHPNDWIFGNLPLLRTQYRIARNRFLDELADLPEDAHVSVMGHSLGGGIAVSMYRHFPERIVRARAFNSSPLHGCPLLTRAKCLRDSTLARLPDVAERKHEWQNTYELGDPTRVVGNLLPWRWNVFAKPMGKDRDRWYRRYDFLGFHLISDHDIGSLAYHLACHAKQPREDVKAAVIAIQCLRDHKGNAAACTAELEMAKGQVVVNPTCSI